MSNPYSAYHESRLQSASPLQLVHLAYEGAINAVIDAQGLPAPMHLQRRKAAITKAQLIIGELRRMLDLAAGGEIAIQLARLYEYMNAELNKAVYLTKGNSLAQVRTLLSTLDEGWNQISNENQAVPEVNSSYAQAPPQTWSEEPALPYSYAQPDRWTDQNSWTVPAAEPAYAQAQPQTSTEEPATPYSYAQPDRWADQNSWADQNKWTDQTESAPRTSFGYSF